MEIVLCTREVCDVLAQAVRHRSLVRGLVLPTMSAVMPSISIWRTTDFSRFR